MSSIGYFLSRVASLAAALKARFPGLLAWLRQTSTILGLATSVGIVTAALQHTMSWDVAAPGLAGALVSMLMPGHPDVETMARRAALDAVLLAQHDPRFVGAAGFATDVGNGLVAAQSIIGASAEMPGKAT